MNYEQRDSQRYLMSAPQSESEGEAPDRRTASMQRRHRLHKSLDRVLDGVYAKRAGRDLLGVELNAPMPKNEANPS
jgi:hypothetical protein